MSDDDIPPKLRAPRATPPKPFPHPQDPVEQEFWQRCQGGPMEERDLAEVLLALGGRSFAKELAAWVHGTRELPLAELVNCAHVCRLPAVTKLIARRLAEASDQHPQALDDLLAAAAEMPRRSAMLTVRRPAAR